MKIEINREKEEFYLHFSDGVIFTVGPDDVTLLLTKPELEKLVAFGNAELQDSDETI